MNSIRSQAGAPKMSAPKMNPRFVGRLLLRRAVAAVAVLALAVVAPGALPWPLASGRCAAEPSIVGDKPAPNAAGAPGNGGPVAVVDRVEGDYAVIVGDDGAVVDVPVAWLEPGTGEGDVLRRGLRVDRRATQQRRNAARRLFEDLLKKQQGKTAGRKSRPLK